MLVGESVPTIQHADLGRAQSNQPVGRSHPDAFLAILQQGSDAIVRQCSLRPDPGLVAISHQKKSVADCPQPHISRVILGNSADHPFGWNRLRRLRSASRGSQSVIGAQPNGIISRFPDLIDSGTLKAGVIALKFSILDDEQTGRTTGKNFSVATLAQAKKGDICEMKFLVNTLELFP